LPTMKKKEKKIELGDLVCRSNHIGTCGIVIPGTREGYWCIYWLDHESIGGNHPPDEIHLVAKLVRP
jgi:hypothetical protein